MNIAVLIPLFLVILGLGWGFWLVFRKGDMVSQPMKMLGYFTGALLALFIAGFLTVIIFPAWANQLLDMATKSSSVQGIQGKTQQLIDESLGQPTPIPQPTTPASPIPTSTPGGTSNSGTVAPLAVTPAPGQITYVVQLNDTLYSIARKYGVTVQSIQAANHLTNPNDIKAGQTLIIPKQ